MKLLKYIFLDPKNFEDKLSGIPIQKEIFISILQKIKYIEYDIEDVCYLVGIFSEYQSVILNRVFDQCSIDYKLIDLSEVIFHKEIKTDYKDEGVNISDEFKTIIEEFYDKNITVDIILDKINSKGLKSLNEKELKILASF